MRAATLVRVCLVLMFVASIGVAGTTVAMKTAETFLAQADLNKIVAPTDATQNVQADQLDRQLRSYQVRLTPEGEVTGRVNVISPVTGAVSAAQDISVTFLQNGQVVAETLPGLEGRFEVALQPGTYAVVGAGPDGYVAFGMNVLPAELTVDSGDPSTQPVMYQEVQSELAIDSVAVPVSDLPTVISLARNNIPADLLQPSPSGEGMTPGPSIADQVPPDTGKNVALSGHQVQIRPDGRLEGRVDRINQNGEPTRIRRTNVFLVKNNQVVAQAPVDELGSFAFFDVDPDVYSFVAAGVEGLAAFTLQAVNGPGLAGVADELVVPVALNNAAAGGGTGGMTGGENAGAAVNAAEGASGGGGAGGPGQGGPQATGEPGEGEGAAAGGGGGGGTPGGGGSAGGGGGFGGGGGWLGTALAAGALGLAGAALAEANDNNNNRRITNSGL